MQVRDVMTTDLEVLGPDTTVRELETRLISHRVGGFPVVDAGRLVGLVTRSDLVRILEVEKTLDDQLDAPGSDTSNADEAARQRGARIGARLATMTVADVMVRDVRTVAVDADVSDAARSMVEQHIHRLPVVDGERLVGIMTSLDLARLVRDGRVS